MNPQTIALYDAAVILYADAPSAETLLNLNRHALALLNAAQGPTWKSVEAPDAFAESFNRIRVVCDRRLDEGEVECLAGCLGYALRATLAGDDLGQPETTYALIEGGAAFTIIEADYDSDSSIRTEPDPAQAFDAARLYITQGTPVRQTDRAGWGTRGTRLVEGIVSCNLSFYLQ